MKNPWKTLKKKVIYKNKYGYTVRVDKVLTPGKTKGEYLVIESTGYIFIVAITPDGKVILERQWRYPIEEESLELPAGHVDSENPLASAKRELFEETGAKSDDWHSLGSHWLANGVMRDRGYVFLALNAKFKHRPPSETDEEISVELMDFNKAVKKVNDFSDYRTQMGLLLAKEYLKNTK